MPMLHELHIFGPLPAAVLQEALRGLSVEPVCEEGGRFDRFRNRPPHGLRSLHPDGAQSLHPDGAQNLHPDGARNLHSDGAQSLHPDGVQNLHPDSVQNLHPDGAQSLHPDGVQNLHPDSVQNLHPDGVQSWRISGLNGAEERRRLLGALLVPVREARATALLRVVGSEIRGAAFDLEGTLTELEFVDALAERLGFGARMQAQTRASMTGRTRDFRRDYEERMAALRGIGTAVMEEVIGSMTLAAGVDALCRRLHAAAIPVAVISGGCSRLGEAVRKKIALRALYATVWEERDARFTGRAASPVVDPAGKLRALEDFAHTISCPLGNMAAAGDGANDIEMLSAAGTSLLTHATARPAWPEILAALL